MGESRVVFFMGMRRWFFFCSSQGVVPMHHVCLALIIKTMPNVNVCITVDRNKGICFAYPWNSRTFIPD